MPDSMIALSRRAALARAAGILGILVVPRGLFALSRKPFPHPDPRPGITAEKVLGDDVLGSSRSVLRAYRAARAHPELFDGLYCVCDCGESMKHRSLLGCFESNQAVGCLSCREQAALVVELVRKEQTLDQIRSAFDEKWG